MRDFPFTLFTDKQIAPSEFAALMGALGWGYESAYNADPERVARSIAGATFAVYARDSEGRLVGYLTVLSDGAYSAHLDIVVVHPSVQRRGIGTALVRAAEDHFAGIPMYIISSNDQKAFFEKLGYKVQTTRPMSALSKRNGMVLPDV